MPSFSATDTQADKREILASCRTNPVQPSFPYKPTSQQPRSCLSAQPRALLIPLHLQPLPEHLLFARHCALCQGYSRERTDKDPVLMDCRQSPADCAVV